MDIFSQYDILGNIDEGSFGSVLLGREKESGREVAIKKMKRKYRSWQECIELREIKALSKLKHPCLVKLLKVLKFQDELFLVFEFVSTNLYKLYLTFRNKVGKS